MPDYPVRLIPTADGAVLLTFPDLPGVELVAADEEAAIAGAPAALQKGLARYKAESRPLPAPSDICGAPTVAAAETSP
ncbi:MAG: type II toxin-antitoxin system HicB family antitoxin [Alphaproteobacteria bacterium]|nr:MAG: type II toxin-antitoxin system HicB family antitoxin [Alphaproteobacteria bacterium]